VWRGVGSGGGGGERVHGLLFCAPVGEELEVKVRIWLCHPGARQRDLFLSPPMSFLSAVSLTSQYFLRDEV